MKIIAFFLLTCLSFSQNSETMMERDFQSYENRVALAEFLPQTKYGNCSRCGLEWFYVNSHCTTCSDVITDSIKTEYGRSYWGEWGFCPICTYCWEELTPKERLPFYKKSWDENTKEFRDILNDRKISKEIKELTRKEIRKQKDNWILVEKAVLDGK